MLCPVCGSDEIYVRETQPEKKMIRRRRRCENCQYTFKTIERIRVRKGKKDGKKSNAAQG